MGGVQTAWKGDFQTMKNRFAGLQAAKQLQDNKEIEIEGTLQDSHENQLQVKTDVQNNEGENALSPKRGRPNGKRSNADFQQVTAYVRRDTYRQVSMKLLDRHNKGEFSELIEDLLQKWIKE